MLSCSKILHNRFYSLPNIMTHTGLFKSMQIFSPDRVENKSISSYDLITFDVFDTLLTRPLFTPADLFLICAHQMSQIGVIAIDPARWRSIRCSAEQQLQNRSRGVTYSITEIYKQISQTLEDDNFNPTDAAEIELEIEAALSKSIFKTNQLLRNINPNVEMSLISDTYFTSENLHKILEECGVPHHRANIVSSCSVGLTKEYGGLFLYARTKKGGSYIKHLHIGDNVWSDVYRAAFERSNALFYNDGKRTYIEKYLYQNLPSQEIVRSAIAGSIRSARLQINTNNDHEQGVVEIATSLVGPLLTSYVCWIIKEAHKLGIRKLFFFSREGEILIKIAKPLIDFYKLNISVEYLYVSRQSLHLPALDGLSADDLSSMNIRHPISAAKIFTKLEMEVDEALRAALLQCGYHGPTDNTELSERDLERLIGALRSDAIMPFIERQASMRRQALIAYLRSKGLFGDHNIGFVDIGWKGRLQRSLCMVARDIDPHIDLRVTGFYYSLFDKPSDSGRLLAYTDVDGHKNIKPYVRAALFEVFCAAQHGTTLYYKFDAAGHVKAVLASDDNPRACRWGVGLQQQAAEAFLKHFLSVNKFIQINLDTIAIDMHSASEILCRHIIGFPTKSHADTIGSFPHADDEPADGSFEIAPPIPFSPRKWIRRFQRRKYRPLISNWPEGSIIRALPRPLGSLLIYKANGIKKIIGRFRGRRRYRLNS